jgi:hypothetical protein
MAWRVSFSHAPSSSCAANVPEPESLARYNVDVLQALIAVVGGIGEALGAFTMARFLGDGVARVTDDFRRSRATSPA